MYHMSSVGVGRRYYLVGPRKVTVLGGCAAVYLGKEFNFLKGRKVMLVFEVLEEEESKVKT